MLWGVPLGLLPLGGLLGQRRDGKVPHRATETGDLSGPLDSGREAVPRVTAPLVWTTRYSGGPGKHLGQTGPNGDLWLLGTAVKPGCRGPCPPVPPAGVDVKRRRFRLTHGAVIHFLALVTLPLCVVPRSLGERGGFGPPQLRQSTRPLDSQGGRRYCTGC